MSWRHPERGENKPVMIVYPVFHYLPMGGWPQQYWMNSLTCKMKSELHIWYIHKMPQAK